jgi:hypothetical protein
MPSCAAYHMAKLQVELERDSGREKVLQTIVKYLLQLLHVEAQNKIKMLGTANKQFKKGLKM